MYNIGIWTGGWVIFGSNTKKYYNSNRTEYDSSLGDESNPCPISIYNEMLLNGIWEGGWVMGPDGIPHYIRVIYIALDSGEGCGCGCGCGSGCGSGSGSGSGSGNGSGSGSGGGSGSGSNSEYYISAGNCNLGKVNGRYWNEIKQEIEIIYIGDLYINWTAGYTYGQDDLSAVHVSLMIKDNNVTISHSNINTEWKYPYVVSFHGNITICYKQCSYNCSIDGHYTIPAQYYNDK